MKIKNALGIFQTEFLRTNDLQTLDVSRALDELLSFYAEKRAENCDLQSDGDMLLFQWGVHDWENGVYFELNFTRQFIESGAEDEDIWQLALTFRYALDDELRALPMGNRWCADLSAITDFKAFVKTSFAFQASAARQAAQVTLHHFCAG